MVPRTEVRGSTIEGAGRGLFATNTIAKGAVIAAQQSPVSKPVTPSKDEATLQADVRDNDCPDDAIVFFEPHRGASVGFWDQEVTNGKVDDVHGMPKWYRMNHPGPNDSANVKLTHVSGELLWVAHTVINAGDELFWVYGMTKNGIGDGECK